MTSYTLSPFLLTRIQTDGAVIDFYCHILLHAAYFCVFFSSCFCLFLRQILAEAEKALSKTKATHVRISSDFCRLLITYANSLDLDQDRQQVRIACALILMGKKINFLMTAINYLPIILLLNHVASFYANTC